MTHETNNPSQQSRATGADSVTCSAWLGDMRMNVAAGLREARRHVRSCKNNRANLAWAHRKGEIAALRGVARLLKPPMSPSKKAHLPAPAETVERKKDSL